MSSVSLSASVKKNSSEPSHFAPVCRSHAANASEEAQGSARAGSPPNTNCVQEIRKKDVQCEFECECEEKQF